jgi:hypothetical protein
MIRFLLIFLAVAILSGCTPPEKADFEQAQKYSSQGEFKLALGLFDRVIKRNSGSDRTIEAAREAARISFYETKGPPTTSNFWFCTRKIPRSACSRKSKWPASTSMIFKTTISPSWNSADF